MAKQISYGIMDDNYLKNNFSKYLSGEKPTIIGLLEKMNLEHNYFAVLVNGKKAEMDYILKEKDEITILPKIAGGSGIEELI